MKNNQLQPVHGGCFYVNDTAAKDDICQQVMASYLNKLKAEAQHRDRVRQGLEPANDGQWTNWNISDRH
jgi:hypothetical protein